MSTTSPFDLSGKTAVVTGARRGIGMAMAVALAEAGADIIGVSANLEAEGSAVGHAVTALGRSFTAMRADFADRAAVHQLAADLTAAGPIDILVNNGGTIARTPAAQHPDDMWDQVIEVNLSSQFILSREVGRQMLERGSGKIIFTASLLSFQGGINVPGYTASKSGIAGLTKALANEWAPRGVNVNAIAPGYIATDNTQALQDDPDRERGILERIPAARWGRPDDLAGATVFLASPASDYIHGVVLPVDGGWLGR
ncbi:MAG: 2-deoxy-D-gluconate 3-dehydrogenase [Micrococcaceae bacterium]|jgi:2-deoxy-D-gluconate 3-dehydrogenase|uniref:SDR family oxidoreductase n=1 Tax=Arthrobacter cheniae TaxID=1258888 RepID=A0A3A5M6R3_9MICC|nr:MULTISPECIES: SDR family oxidoreductase [Arthrobacter]MCU1632687.1 2-deoxy-D-gluconate 3-dehydrogenase [Micrococcaceae bacterium]MEC5200967.1 2-deoxy-D-gluconate 3-dehydrogenase [Arthrobacter sp. PL16]RJT75763.1 SDR family oxidoreductase [Arthrobacter cheniae]